MSKFAVLRCVAAGLVVLEVFERLVGWLSGSIMNDAGVVMETVVRWYLSVPIYVREVFRTVLDVSLIVAVVAYLVCLFVENRKGKNIGRNVPEKRALQAAWKKQIDGLITQAKSASDKKAREIWRHSVIHLFEDFLSPHVAAEFCREFEKRVVGWDGRGQASSDAVGSGTRYLESRRDFVKDQQFK